MRSSASSTTPTTGLEAGANYYIVSRRVRLTLPGEEDDMESLLVALPALGCAVMMPAMLWVMSRMRHDTPRDAPPLAPRAGSTSDDELRVPRDDVARLRSEVDAGPARREPTDG